MGEVVIILKHTDSRENVDIENSKQRFEVVCTVPQL